MGHIIIVKIRRWEYGRIGLGFGIIFRRGGGLVTLVLGFSAVGWSIFG